LYFLKLKTRIQLKAGPLILAGGRAPTNKYRPSSNTSWQGKGRGVVTYDHVWAQFD